MYIQSVCAILMSGKKQLLKLGKELLKRLKKMRGFDWKVCIRFILLFILLFLDWKLLCKPHDKQWPLRLNATNTYVYDQEMSKLQNTHQPMIP